MKSCDNRHEILRKSTTVCRRLRVASSKSKRDELMFRDGKSIMPKSKSRSQYKFYLIKCYAYHQHGPLRLRSDYMRVDLFSLTTWLEVEGWRHSSCMVYQTMESLFLYPEISSICILQCGLEILHKHYYIRANYNPDTNSFH